MSAPYRAARHNELVSPAATSARRGAETWRSATGAVLAVTSRDVAVRAGVSQATVSRVLNDSPSVSPENRSKVLAALEATGYVLNAQARAMRTSRSGSIGIVTSEIQNPFLPYLLDELARSTGEMGLNAMVWNDDSPEARQASEGLASGVVDGVVFTAARSDSVGIRSLILSGAPVVLCNRASLDSAADVVMTDHEACGRMSAEYLLNHGRQNLAAIFGSRDTFASPLREAGFRAAMAAAGVALDRRLVRRGRTAYESGLALTTQLVKSGAPIDAIFCSSDIIAYGAMDALRLHGVRVPDDVWVIGIDGLPMSEWSAFDLTTFKQDVTRVARGAVERIVARVGGDQSPPSQELVPAALTVRGSTAQES